MSWRLFDLFTVEQPPWHRRVLQLAFAVYCLIVAVSTPGHSLWGDEADPWVMARETNLHDFLRYFSSTGHPPLWFSVIFPLARIGLPPLAMQIANGTFAIAVAYVVLLRSPFSIWIRITFMFSMYMAFQYAVVARGYMLMILVMVLIADGYRLRFERPWRHAALLGLLANTEVFAAIPAACLTILYAVECWRNGSVARRIAPLAVIVALGAVAAVSLIPLDGVSTTQKYYRATETYPQAFDTNVRRAFFAEVVWRPQYYAALAEWRPLVEAAELWMARWWLVLGAVIMIGTAWFWVAAGWLATFYALFTWIYHGEYWHAGLMPVFLLWTLWMFHQSGARLTGWRIPVSRGLAAGLLLSFVIGDQLGFTLMADAWRRPFSGGKAMAQAIQRERGDRVLASVACFQTASVAAYLPRGTTFWIVGENRISPYVLWGAKHDRCMEHYNHLDAADITRAPSTRLLMLSSGTFNAARDLPIAIAPVDVSPGLFERFHLHAIDIRTVTTPAP